MTKLHLYKFTGENQDNNIYLVSVSEDEQMLRAAMRYTDHGGMDYEVFRKVWQEGELVEITSLKQIPESDLKIIPYTTDEWYEDEDDYLDYDDTIENFKF